MPNCWACEILCGRSLKKYLLLVLGWLAVMPAAPGVSLHAQTTPAATSRGLVVWAGAEYSNFQTDFEGGRLGGIGVYADFDRTAHWGAETEARWFRFEETAGQSGSNYLIGLRYRRSFDHGTIVPYAKFLAGAGLMNYPHNIGHGSYFALAPGAGVDFRIRPRLSVRADYEYQRWPAAPGFPGLPSHGLSPNGISIGFAWRIP